MKTIGFLFVLVLFSLLNGCNTSQKKHTDLDDYNLKGKVMSVTQETYTVNNDNGVLRKGQPIHNIYNTKTELYFNREGFLEGKVVMLPGNEVISKTISMFNPEGRTEAIYILNGEGEPLSSSKYVYGDKGDIKEIEVFGSDKKLQETKAYVYDDSNFLTGIDITAANGVMIEKYVITNDKKGNPTQQICYDAVDNMLSKTVYKRDRSGKITSICTYNGGGQLLMTESFNQQGDEISWEGEGREETYSYTYDHYGNWSEKTLFENGEPKFLTERQIQYY